MAWYDKLAKAGTAFLQGFGDELPRAQARHQQNEARRDQKTQRELDRIQKQFEFLPQTEREGFIAQLRERGESVPEYAQLADELAARTRGRAAELASAYDLALVTSEGAVGLAPQDEAAPLPKFGGMDAFVESRTQTVGEVGQAVQGAMASQQSFVGVGGTPTEAQTGRVAAVRQAQDLAQRRLAGARELQYGFRRFELAPALTEEHELTAQQLWAKAELPTEQFDAFWGSYTAAHRDHRNQQVMDALANLDHTASDDFVSSLVKGADLGLAQAAWSRVRGAREAYQRAVSAHDQSMIESKTAHFLEVRAAAQKAMDTGFASKRADPVEDAAKIYDQAGFNEEAQALRQNKDAYKLAYNRGMLELIQQSTAEHFRQAFVTEVARNALKPGLDGKPVDSQASVLNAQATLAALLRSQHPELYNQGSAEIEARAAANVDAIMRAAQGITSEAVASAVTTEMSQIRDSLPEPERKATMRKLQEKAGQLHPAVASVWGITPVGAAPPTGEDEDPLSDQAARTRAGLFDPNAPGNAGPPSLTPRSLPGMGPAPDRPSPRAQVRQGRNANPQTPRALTELGPQQGMTKRHRDAINRQRAMRGLPPLTTPVR